jgi:anti-repressor protein
MDVLNAAGIKNVGNIKKRLDQAYIHTMDVWSESNGRNYSNTVINEAGLYDVILDSRKPQAKRFRRWVVNDILPMIRKTGGYVTKETHEREATTRIAVSELCETDTGIADRPCKSWVVNMQVKSL